MGFYSVNIHCVCHASQLGVAALHAFRSQAGSLHWEQCRLQKTTLTAATWWVLYALQSQCIFLSFMFNRKRYFSTVIKFSSIINNSSDKVFNHTLKTKVCLYVTYEVGFFFSILKTTFTRWRVTHGGHSAHMQDRGQHSGVSSSFPLCRAGLVASAFCWTTSWPSLYRVS